MFPRNASISFRQQPHVYVSNSLVGSAKNNGIAFSTFSFLLRMYIFTPYPLCSMPPQKFQSRRILTGNLLPKQDGFCINACEELCIGKTLTILVFAFLVWRVCTTVFERIGNWQSSQKVSENTSTKIQSSSEKVRYRQIYLLWLLDATTSILCRDKDTIILQFALCIIKTWNKNVFEVCTTEM